MLSEDEKQAIEKLKKIREDTIKANECGLSNNDFKEEIEVYNTVLNLITKLQKENEEKDKKNKKYIDIISKKIIDVLKDELVQQKNKEIDLKDKQIDLMARRVLIYQIYN